jgi:hypothetical protein
MRRVAEIAFWARAKASETLRRASRSSCRSLGVRIGDLRDAQGILAGRRPAAAGLVVATGECLLLYVLFRPYHGANGMHCDVVAAP